MSVETVQFSFVVLTFNSARYIGRCLSALAETVSALGVTAELFIIDNGSRDDTRALIREFALPAELELTLIEFEYNTGTTFSRNQALAKVRGDYIVVLDSDAYLNAEALNGLREFLQVNPDCGMAVPRLTYPDGRWQMSTDEFPGVLRKVQRFFFLKDIEAREVQNLVSGKVDYAISACWVMPAAVVKQVGLDVLGPKRSGKHFLAEIFVGRASQHIDQEIPIEQIDAHAGQAFAPFTFDSL